MAMYLANQSLDISKKLKLQNSLFGALVMRAVVK